MATIRTAIAIYDGVTSPLKSMQKAMNIVINSFETMQSTSGRAVDVSAIQEAREELARAGTAFDAIEQNIQEADRQQQRLNQDLNSGVSGAGALLDKVKGIVAAYAGIQGVKKALGWVKDNLGMADTQRAAETQLKTVLANVGAAEGAFDRLAAKASSIQNAGMYGDEAMLGGAAELATYIKDASALESMMGTLANYAAGMSGGGEVDQKAMVDYATQLGKALDGTYDGLKKKGFELSDAQKQIIENGTDMEKALVLDEVIAQSWDHLYETMSNIPEGKIISLKNRWGDLKETIGNKLYPVVLRVVDSIEARWPQIESVMNGITQSVGMLVGILGVLLDLAINVASAFVDNWGWIAPIVAGAIAALLAYEIATKGVAVAEGIATAAKIIAVPVYSLLTGATMKATASQWGLNAALYACPLVWIIMLVIMIIALFYAAVAAVNKFAGTSISATGIICGAFMVALAFIGNLFIGLWNVAAEVFVLIYNLVATVANFIGNVFNDPVGAVCRLFFDLADTVLGVLQALASAIDAVFGSNLSGAVQGWRDSLGGWVDSTFGSGTEIMAKMTADDMKLDRFEYGAAWDAGYSFGEGIDSKVSGLFDFGVGDSLEAFDMGNTLDGIYSNTGDTAANTAAAADALSYTEEDLAYLKDIAEREAINRFTTAEIHVEQHNENHISSAMDVDGIMDAWANDFAEKLDVSEEGVHE